jgi:hypothetical protein
MKAWTSVNAETVHRRRFLTSVSSQPLQQVATDPVSTHDNRSAVQPKLLEQGIDWAPARQFAPTNKLEVRNS